MSLTIPKTGIFYSGDSGSPFVNKYLQSRDSYSGCDMVATITVPQLGGVDGINPIYTIGELHTFSYSIHTEDKPVRSFASKGIKAFTSGPRTIAGSMVFSVFDRHVFRNISNDLRKKYSTNKLGGKQSLISNKILGDEMPPFNVTITFANEYGHTSSLTIYNIHVEDEGQVMSIDDIMTENTMSYFALDISLMDIMERGKRPDNSILNDQELIYGTEVKKPKYGDNYVYGKITKPNGDPIDSEFANLYDIVVTCKDGLKVNGIVTSDSRYFVYTATAPSKVEIFLDDTRSGLAISGNGHCWDIKMT